MKKRQMFGCVKIIEKPILMILMLAVSILNIRAQDAQEEKYQRSSLSMIIFSNDMNILLKKSEPKSIDYIRNEIVKSWNSYPFPDKYNNHNIPTQDLKLSTQVDFNTLARLKQEKNTKKDAETLLPMIQQQLIQQKVANQLVRTWFSSKDGEMFDMEYIKEMGLYNVSDEDLDYFVAKTSARGLAILEDAGENLINNTFVTVTELIFCSNEPLAEAYQTLADELLKEADKINSGNDLTDAISKAAYTLLATGFSIAAAAKKDGYSAFFKTFLFKLKWNEEIAANFYSIWGDENAFERMNFELEFIGYQYNDGNVDAGVFTKSKNREIEIVLNKAIVRTLDASFATLQYENDVFKPMIPILSIDPITAKIGMKEGLLGNEKFAIMLKVTDPVTYKTNWKKIGTTKVNKKLVWDNRYNAGDKPENVVIGKDGLPIKVTTFEPTGSAREGMFLKQIMTKKKKKKK
jgi:hypothetical protein